MHGWIAAVLNLLGMGAGTPAVAVPVAACGDFVAVDELAGAFAAADEIAGSFTAPEC